MAYCRNCGAEISDVQDICLSCGKILKPRLLSSTNQADTGNWAWGILGFFFPLAGVIIYFVLRKSKPRTAKVVGKGALVSLILWIVSIFILLILFSILLDSLSTFNR